MRLFWIFDSLQQIKRVQVTLHGDSPASKENCETKPPKWSNYNNNNFGPDFISRIHHFASSIRVNRTSKLNVLNRLLVLIRVMKHVPQMKTEMR